MRTKMILHSWTFIHILNVLSKEDADKILDDLREQAEQNRQKMQMERRRYPMEDWQEKVLTKLYRRGHLSDVPTYFSYYEANDLIEECRKRGIIRSYEIEDIKKCLAHIYSHDACKFSLKNYKESKKKRLHVRSYWKQEVCFFSALWENVINAASF